MKKTPPTRVREKRVKKEVRSVTEPMPDYIQYRGETYLRKITVMSILLPTPPKK